MKIRNLLMATALLTVVGLSVSAVAAEQESVMVKPSWNSLQDGAPPPLSSNEQAAPQTAPVNAQDAERRGATPEDLAEVDRRASRSKSDIVNEQSDEQVEWMRNHNKEIYGTEEGPFTELEKQEQLAIEAKKRVSVYGMTYAEREAMLQAEAAAAKKVAKPATEAAKETKPSTGYIYNRKKNDDAPPRLFNNVTR